jgi:Mn2+/Fe2+ NRAMP family transporter
VDEQAVNTQDAAPQAPPPEPGFRRLLAFGPGIVFVLCAVGPSDLVSGSVAGSAYGYSLLWLLVLALLARYLILDATARYVMVSGETLLAGFGRISRWILLLWFLMVLLKRHLSGLVKLVLLGTASHIVLPLPTPHSVAIWGLSWWVIGFALMYWGRYGVIEKLSKPLAFLLGACLAAAAIMSRPAPAELVTGVLSPVIPTEPGLYGPVVVLMTVMSATASFSNLKYSAFVHEKGWRSASFLRGQRMDLLLSMGSVFCMLAMIQIAAAGLLRPRGIEVGAIEDLIPIFSQVLGDWGRIVLGVTLWALAFSNYLGSTTSYGIMISDVYYRFIRRDPEIAERNQAAGKMPAYRWLVLYVFISPLYVFFFTDWTPVWLLLLQDAAGLLSLPLIILAVLRLTIDKKIMGIHVNNWFTNVVLLLTTVAAVYLGYNGAAELLRSGS